MNLLIITLSLLCHSSLSAKDTLTPLQSKVYVITAEGTSAYVSGYLQSIQDSVLTISSEPVSYGVSQEGKLVPYTAINSVRLHRKGKVGRGIVIGIIGGAVLGAIIGGASYHPCSNCWFAIDKSTVVAGSSLLGLLPGGLIGGLIGTAKHHYKVNKSKEGFDAMRTQLLQVYGSR